MGEYEQITYAVADRVATITLSRPEQLNAYTPQMGAELLDALDRVDADDDVRVVILTGAGRAFCAGADLSAGGDRFEYPDGEHVDPGGVLTLRLRALRKPVIAALNGSAAGIGATLPLAADLRLAASTARIAFGFTRIGLAPEAASAWFLPQAVGLQRALEWTLTGRRIDAADALAAGLLRSVHEPDELLPAAYVLAAEIAENTAPVAVAVTRQMLWDHAGDDGPEAAHRSASAAMKALGSSADVREGIEAFLEKRKPEFGGKVSTDLPD